MLSRELEGGKKRERERKRERDGQKIRGMERQEKSCLGATRS